MTRLWPKATAAIVLALGCAGCSFSMQLDELAKADRPEVTGSIDRAKSDMPPEGDLVFTRAAVSEVFTSGRKDSAVPWENPATGARGTVTAIASTDADGACRDFLASYVHKDNEAWMQGEACRARAGVWEVRSLKPWKRT